MLAVQPSSVTTHDARFGQDNDIGGRLLPLGPATCGETSSSTLSLELLETSMASPQPSGDMSRKILLELLKERIARGAREQLSGDRGHEYLSSFQEQRGKSPH